MFRFWLIQPVELLITKFLVYLVVFDLLFHVLNDKKLILSLTE